MFITFPHKKSKQSFQFLTDLFNYNCLLREIELLNHNAILIYEVGSSSQHTLWTELNAMTFDHDFDNSFFLSYFLF